MIHSHGNRFNAVKLYRLLIQKRLERKRRDLDRRQPGEVGINLTIKNMLTHEMHDFGQSPDVDGGTVCSPHHVISKKGHAFDVIEMGVGEQHVSDLVLLRLY